MNRTLKLFICVVGIYVSFITWAVFQEKVSTAHYSSPQSDVPDAKFVYIKFLNLFQAVFATVTAIVICVVQGYRLSLHPFSDYLIIALTNTLGSPFSYMALKFIAYPMVTLVKSCKLVPVMVMGAIVGKKKFSFLEFLCCVLLSAGVVMYTCLKPGMQTGDNLQLVAIGCGLVLLNLAFDGCTNAMQDKIYSQYKMSAIQMMFAMNAISSVLLCCALVSPIDFDQLPFYTGKWELSAELWVGFESSELFDAIQFVVLYPSCLYDIILFSLCGALGQVFIFTCVHDFGSVINTMVTITRKFFTILVSNIYFGHQTGGLQKIGVALVFLGLGIEAYTSYHKKKSKHHGSHGSAHKHEEHTVSNESSSVVAQVSDGGNSVSSMRNSKSRKAE